MSPRTEGVQGAVNGVLRPAEALAAEGAADLGSLLAAADGVQQLEADGVALGVAVIVHGLERCRASFLRLVHHLVPALVVAHTELRIEAGPRRRPRRVWFLRPSPARPVAVRARLQ